MEKPKTPFALSLSKGRSFFWKKKTGLRQAQPERLRGKREQRLTQDFLFPRFRHGVDGGYRRVGELLHLGLVALALVLADLLLAFVRFQFVHAVAANIAHRDAGLFGILAGKLRQFLAAFLRHFGDRQAQHLAVDDRVEPETRRANRLVDRADVRLRSAARLVGKECVSPCRSRWSPYP